MSRDHTLGPVADRLLAGEYEPALVEWVDGLSGRGANRDAGEVGVTGEVGDGDRTLIHLGRTKFQLPARDLLPPLYRYARLVLDGEERLVGYVEASHGCAHRCRHCPVPVVYDGRIRIVDRRRRRGRRGPARGARHITFGDPDFLNGAHHSLRVVRAVHDRFPDLTFDCTTKVEHILRHEGVRAELVAAGRLFVVSAFESVNDATSGSTKVTPRPTLEPAARSIAPRECDHSGTDQERGPSDPRACWLQLPLHVLHAQGDPHERWTIVTAGRLRDGEAEGGHVWAAWPLTPLTSPDHRQPGLSYPSGRRPVASGLLARGPRLGRTGSDLVPADVGARCLVRDPFDLRLGEHLPEELKFRGAGLTVAGRHSPDGAAVQGHPVAAVGELVEVGQIPLSVEDLGQDRHLLVEALARQLHPGLLDTPAAAPLEDAGDELGVFLLDVAEQLDREVAGASSEQGLAQIGAVVEIGGPSGPTSLLTRGDEAGGLEGGQVLADAAWRDPQGLRQLVC